MSTYKELLQNARNILKQQKIADADVDAWYLLSHVFKIERINYFMDQDKSVSEEDGERYLALVKKRASHIPLQHITGTQEFMGLEFEVNEHVLIPRQDTEILVEEVLKACKGKTVLDLCTGSGCIIISLAKLGQINKAAGSDISEKALAVAAKNAFIHKVEIEFIQGNLFERVMDTYDIIVSNPPYIPTAEVKELMPEVREHEPVLALDGSDDGLIFYREIISNAKKYLNKNGVIYFEIGHNQGEAVKQLLEKEGFSDICVKRDLSGLDRVVSAKYVHH